MDDKPNGGEAPQPEKPKKPIADIIEFSYHELMPIGAFREDNTLFLTFLVSDEYYLSFSEFEYYSYLNSYFSQLADAQEAGTCTCDSCVLNDFTVINDNDELTIHTIKENEEEESKVKIIPHYSTHSLSQNLIVGLHNDH